MAAEFDDEDTIRRRGRAALASDSATATVERPPRWSASTSRGRRPDNQDAWAHAANTSFVVADGVGGMHGGRTASTATAARFVQVGRPADWAAAIGELNRQVRSQCRHDGVADAATTLVGCVIAGAEADIVHVGDSRAYLWRDHNLTLLTTDHNVGEARRAHGLTFDTPDPRGRPRALTSFIGAEPDELVVSIRTVGFEAGDRLLLSSDGVHEQLSESLIAEILARAPVEAAAGELTRAADAAGGRDNATVVVVAPF